MEPLHDIVLFYGDRSQPPHRILRLVLRPHFRPHAQMVNVRGRHREKIATGDELYSPVACMRANDFDRFHRVGHSPLHAHNLYCCRFPPSFGYIKCVRFLPQALISCVHTRPTSTTTTTTTPLHALLDMQT